MRASGIFHINLTEYPTKYLTLFYIPGRIRYTPVTMKKFLYFWFCFHTYSVEKLIYAGALSHEISQGVQLS